MQSVKEKLVNTLQIPIDRVEELLGICVIVTHEKNEAVETKMVYLTVWDILSMVLPEFIM